MNPTKTYLKPLASASCIALAALFAPAFAHATEVPYYGLIGGTAKLTYDLNAWSTMRSSSYRTDIHGVPIDGSEAPTSNTFGNRYLYPQLFEGIDVSPHKQLSATASDEAIANHTADPLAVAQWRLDNPADRVPVAQPAGGWEMPVDTWGVGVPYNWAPGFQGSGVSLPGDGIYNTVISLGGSLRVTSDFIAPGGTLWWSNLTLENDSYTGKWYIGSQGYSLAVGTIFELIDPKIGTDPLTGAMSLDADYKWGDLSTWSNFFSFAGTPEANTVLGHISMNVSAVPVPAAVWLFGTGLFGLVGYQRRKAFA